MVRCIGLWNCVPRAAVKALPLESFDVREDKILTRKGTTWFCPPPSPRSLFL